MISKQTQPDKGLRGRQFEAALTRLAEWWADKFRIDYERGVRHQSYEEAATIASSLPNHPSTDRKGKGKARQVDDEDPDLSKLDYGERIRSVNSLMKHALMMRGSPDISAQLFTALCRSLGLPTRLVVSLQSVLWRKEKSDKEKAVDRVLQKSRKLMKEKAELTREAAIVASAARNASGTSRGTLMAGETSDAAAERALRDSKGKGRVVDPSGPSPALESDLSEQATTRAIKLRNSRPTGRTLADSKGKL